MGIPSAVSVLVIQFIPNERKPIVLVAARGRLHYVKNFEKNNRSFLSILIHQMAVVFKQVLS
jgi:hypothetical protein